jgi:3',5'-cyclic AMP phosphodiesterase CpdA
MITILHISDLQFGCKHRFGRLHSPPPPGAAPLPLDDEFNTLSRRLEDDLDLLAKQRLSPDLIVVTGDLAECGHAHELRDAFNLLAGLSSHLGLPPDRVAVVPGNHDVNRDLCHAYFSECKGANAEPQPPFVRKWGSPAVSMG